MLFQTAASKGNQRRIESVYHTGILREDVDQWGRSAGQVQINVSREGGHVWEKGAKLASVAEARQVNH